MFDIKEYDLFRNKGRQNSVEEDYPTHDSRKNLIILRRETPERNKFQVYDRMNDDHVKILQLILLESLEHHYHEVVEEYAEQKLRFDIEKTLEEGETINIDEVIDKVINTTIYYFDEVIPILTDKNYDTPEVRKKKEDFDGDKVVYLNEFRIVPSHEDFIVCSSSNERKMSLHIILDGYKFKNTKIVGKIVNDITNLLPDPIKTYIDKGIYTGLKSLRVVGSCKLGDDRIKRIIRPGKLTITPLDTLITFTKYAALIDVDFAGNSNIFECTQTGVYNDVNDEDKRIVKRMIEEGGYLNYFEIRSMTSTLVIMNRLRPSYCRFCDREHEKDHTLYFTIEKIVNQTEASDKLDRNNTCCKYIVKERCRRDNKKSYTLGEFIATLTDEDLKVYNDKIKKGEKIPNVQLTSQEEQQLIKDYGYKELILRKSIERILQTNTTPSLDFDHEFLNSGRIKIETYSDPQIRNFELCSTLLVVAPMKMGKTKALNKYIDTHFDETSRIIILSFRQAFSDNIKSIFPEFIIYSEVTGDLIQNKVIVQVESLHRIAITSKVDLLVLDESESIISQIESGLSKKPNECKSKLKWLLEYSKHVVCMDAYMSDRTVDVIMNARKGEIMVQHSIYQNATEDKYFLTKNEGIWYNEIMAKLGKIPHTDPDDDTVIDIDANEPKKIVIMSSSLSEAEGIHETLKQKFPKLNIAFYSSKTLESEKKKVFRDVNNHWIKYDILIYTPTISAGVSFEREHFDYVFATFTNISCDVRTCIQMLGRIRNVKEKTYYIWLNTFPESRIVTVKQLERAIVHDYSSLFGEDVDPPNIRFTENGYAEIAYKDLNYYIWRQNTIIRNRSRASFDYYFIKYVAKNGSMIKSLVQELQDISITNIIPPNFVINAKNYAELFKETRGRLQYTIADCIANSKNITDAEFDALRDKKSKQEDVTEQELYQMDKKKLVNTYRFPIDQVEMTAEFVLTYSKLRGTYAILKDIKDIPFETLLQEYRQYEQQLVTIYPNVDDNFERSRKYTERRIMMEPLMMIGFRHLYDTSVIECQDDTFENVRRYLNRNLMTIQQYYKIQKRINSINDIQTGIKVLKYILKPYGCKLVIRKKKDEESSKCSLQPCSKFNLRPTGIINPYIPTIYDE